MGSFFVVAEFTIHIVRTYDIHTVKYSCSLFVVVYEAYCRNHIHQVSGESNNDFLTFVKTFFQAFFPTPHRIRRIRALSSLYRHAI